MSDTRLSNIYICDLEEREANDEPGVEMVCDCCDTQIWTGPNIEIDTAIEVATLHILECTPGVRWADRATGPDDINVFWPDIWTSVDGWRWRRKRDGSWQREIRP